MQRRWSQQWSRELAEAGEWVRPVPRRDSAARLVAAAVGLAIGVGALAQGDRVLGGVTVALALIAVVVLVLRLLTRGPRLRVDGSGIAIGGAAVPWTGIVGVEVRSLLRTQTVVVLLGPSGRAALAASSSPPRRFGHAVLALVRGRRIWALPTGMGLPAEELADWLRARWLHAVAR